jgi:geranylgeranyl pyrophosphate synthase
MANSTIPPSEASLTRWRDSWVKRVNSTLEKIILGTAKDQGPEIENLVSAMNYTIESGGKRLRALLTLATADAVGGREALAMPAALAIEMIHAYSLIHDDLPALDNDVLRRGRPTCHLVFGESTAILAGDALQSLAFETLCSTRLGYVDDNQRTLRKAVPILAKAIGPVGMAGGQAMDLAFEGRSLSAGQVLTMEEKKTGYLIGACFALGATFGGASSYLVTKLEKAGRQAGLAFQITDDLLNIHGDPIKMGKNVGTDEKKAKASATTVLDQSEAIEQARSLISTVMKAINSLNSKKLEWLLGSIIGRSS